MGTTANPKKISFFLVPGFSLLALSAAVEPLRSLNRILGKNRYDWNLVASRAGPVAAGNGFELNAKYSMSTLPKGHLVFVVASLGVESYSEPAVLSWLRQQYRAEGQIGALSNGTILLARAGLLGTKKVTIHWEMQRQLESECPDVHVARDLFCIDSGIMTAAGGTASLDLMLALIGRSEGRETAADVAAQFLHHPIRTLDTPQIDDARWRYQVTDNRVLRTIMVMEANMSPPLRVSQLAGIVGVSERQLERLFRNHFQSSPSEFYMELRLKTARALLQSSTESLAEISEICGFSSPAHFNRAFRARYDLPPYRFRKRTAHNYDGIVQ